MSASTRSVVVDAYLADLRRAARDLPATERRELLADVTEHLDATLGPDATEAQVRAELGRLGEPDAIVADIAAVGLEADRSGRGPLEWCAIVLLLLGGFLFAFGWLVGVVLLWSSRAWTWKQKLLGTLVVPGGLAAGTLLFLYATLAGLEVCSSSPGQKTACTGGPSPTVEAIGLVVLVFLLVAPVVVAIHLGRTARRRPR